MSLVSSIRAADFSSVVGKEVTGSSLLVAFPLAFVPSDTFIFNACNT